MEERAIQLGWSLLKMIANYDVVVEWNPEGHYVARVLQMPAVQMTGSSVDDLEVEIWEIIFELRKIDNLPPEEFDLNLIRR